MSDLSVSYDAAGPVPKTSEELRADLVSRATELSPGITTDLPGALIEDIVGTDVGALLIADQIRVDLINSVGPLKANKYLLNLLAQQAGISPQKTEGSTTVPVTFSGPAGFVIPQGFLVSDGTYTYQIADATVVLSSGVSSMVTAIATNTGSWAVPVGSVNQIITSLPSDITLACTNPVAGTPGGTPETNYEFRERVWEGQMSTVQGYPGFIRQKLASSIGRYVSGTSTTGVVGATVYDPDGTTPGDSSWAGVATGMTTKTIQQQRDAVRPRNIAFNYIVRAA